MRNVVFMLTTLLFFASIALGQTDGLRRGNQLERQERLEEALELYAVLHRQYPHDMRVFEALKRTCFRLKRYDEFIVLAEQAHERTPQPEYLFALGEANLRKGEPHTASTWLDQFLKNDRTEISYHRVASVYTSANMVADAVEVYDEGRRTLGDDALFAKEMALLTRSSDPERFLRESIALYRTNPEERVWVERTLKEELRAGNQTAVLDAIESAMRSYQDEPELRILLGDILVELDEYEAALDAYRGSEEASALLWLAKECEEEGKFELAIQAYRDYCAKNPNSAEAHIGMGNCYWAIGNLTEAENLYERAANSASGEDAVRALSCLADIRLSRGDLGGARTSFSRIRDNYPIAAAEATFRIIETYVAEGDFDEATKQIEDILPVDPTRAHYLLGEIHYYRADFEKAEEYYEMVIEGDPDGMWVNDSLERLALLGVADDRLRTYAHAEALLLQRKYDMSIEIAKNLLKQDPSAAISPHALFLIAHAYEEKGEHAMAVAGYRDVIANYPESRLCPHAQYRIGLLYLNQMRDIKKARTELETVLFRYPESVIAEKVRNELRSLE